MENSELCYSSIIKEYDNSLKHAEFLQKALFPKQRHFDRVFDDSFIVFKPKQFVSGDFYWLSELNGLTYIVVGDCVGHGVSGAFLSVLVYSLIDYAILNKKIKKTYKIINEIDKRFVESFYSENIEESLYSNHVDMSICCIDTICEKIYFTGARRDLLIVSDYTANLYKGGPYPIGKRSKKDINRFESKSISYKKGDCIYLGSDGFQDQLGGDLTKTYKKKRLHSLLSENSELPMVKQKQLLENELISWTGGNIQTDDICLIGVRL